MSKLFNKDIDPKETQEWIDSIDYILNTDGIDRAKFIINSIIQRIDFNKKNNFKKNFYNVHNYVNSISKKKEVKYPGDLNIEQKILSVVCWNALMIVLRASKKNLDLGGHISSYQSSASIYEVCFNHFFRAKNKKDSGDLVYFQGHISPGIYSRAFVEKRISKEQINNFRQETKNFGLPSYPHPIRMPKFWQFPTVSMGLSAISAIYQAKFLKYLHNRSLKNTTNQTVYVFLGDGEMDEVESKGALNIASREKLDNLIFIVNCNLQRLDGPVFGNGKIINELSNIFNGYGWKVIKVIWGGLWDKLFEKDKSGKLIQLLNETVDGDYQNFSTKDGAYIRKNFFGKYKETYELVSDMSDQEIFNLNRGGHDYKKIYSALLKAKNTLFKPTVILFHTVKGYNMGSLIEGANIAHQIKQISFDNILYFRNRLNLNKIISDNKAKKLSYINFSKYSKEYQYLHKCRKKLYGYLPNRLEKSNIKIILPKLDDFNYLLKKQNRKISTTIAFVRILNILLNNKYIKNIIVPIVADEARTFGMEGLFKKIGIYNSQGQCYTPQDYGKITGYYESKNGQILQEGISELGAVSSWLSAATSYSNNNFPMIPFYIYYSMFGFQRTGDLFWAAGDQQAKGFLIGGTSGRTTLNGEGLQHADGHSHIQSLVIPNCISYDPSFSYELAVIIQNGLNRMYGLKQESIYYYITVFNENHKMLSIPKGSEEGINKGIYRLKKFYGSKNKIQFLGSGSILYCIIEAAEILSQDYNIEVIVYSVTSFTELARDGQDCDRWNILHPMEKKRVPYIASILNSNFILACTDYIKLYAEQIRNYVPTNKFCALGTDGFGLSDSRKNLRKYFEVDSNYIIVATFSKLFQYGEIDYSTIKYIFRKFNVDVNKINPRFI